ncbi:MAG TPA: hypothetical protein VFS20_09770 [Longimicrobium sp.]|nr:hypothetical protein [Longimicrobium sp.]
MDRLLPALRGERNVDVPDDAWEPVDEFGQLSTAISICGLHLYVTAIPVTVQPSDGDPEPAVQVAECHEHDELLDRFTNVFAPDGPWLTATLRGREYVFFAEPFCS